MKLNWAERCVVNNPIRVLEQGFQVRWMKGVLELAPGGTVLEVGCGRGAGAGLIREHFRPASLHAQDLDERMIHKARRYLSPEARAEMFLFVADTVQLPYRHAVMDAVFCFGVLHHVPDWQTALSELARVLKPGGVLYLEEIYPTVYLNPITRHLLLHPRENRFQSQDLHAALRQHQFRMRAAKEHWALGILAVAVKDH
ncbi:MAG TPA: class I SAM-dependent methyltransferase [Syntrophobacteraceae bacterium]|jgi:ubiquinone/menaquinone biosynthesis C-methylase UbiE|nr:class I SAM-dependent methyltransferase [Syntrophobacteraceae bacterium]